MGASLRPLARSGVHAALYRLIATAGWLYRRTHQAAPPSGTDPSRILVIRLDLLGDVLFSMAGVRALRGRFPDAHIAILTLPYTAPLARSYAEVDEVIMLDTNRIRRPRGLLDPGTWTAYWRTARAIRARRFDVAISLSGRTASLCAFLSGSPRTIGYDLEAYPYLLTERVPGGRYRERMHEVSYVLRLARVAGAASAPAHLQVPVSEEARTRVRRLLHEAGIEPADTLVVIHAGSLNGSAKRWPASNWAHFADVVSERTGARVVMAGAGSDGEIARDVTAQAPGVASLVGRTSVPELVALLAEADLVATGDSGPLHLAVALGVPLLAVYGPTDPEVHGPYNPVGPVVLHRRDLACSPCYTMAAMAECPLGDPICMRLVSVSEMAASAVRLLDASARRNQPA